MLRFMPNYLARIFRSPEPDEITVTVEVPPTETPAVENPPVVIVETPPEPTLPTIVELAQQIATQNAEIQELRTKLYEVESRASVAVAVADTAIDIAVETAQDAIEEEITEEPTIPEIEEIPTEVVAEEMPEIEHRQKKRSRFID
jgi:hypothetical protein